jgi:hypothetical protein
MSSIVTSVNKESISNIKKSSKSIFNSKTYRLPAMALEIESYLLTKQKSALTKTMKETFTASKLKSMTFIDVKKHLKYQ